MTIQDGHFQFYSEKLPDNHQVRVTITNEGLIFDVFLVDHDGLDQVVGTWAKTHPEIVDWLVERDTDETTSQRAWWCEAEANWYECIGHPDRSFMYALDEGLEEHVGCGYWTCRKET